MSENTETQTENPHEIKLVQEYEDNSTVQVTRGTKNLPNGERLTILGYDAVLASYAARRQDGRIVNVKAGNVGPVPERTVTLSHLAAMLKGNTNAETLEVFGGDFHRTLSNNFDEWAEVYAKA